MIVIPEYVFRDESFKFKCPSLEMEREFAVRMHNVLTDTRWPDMLKEKKYICHAMIKMGFDTILITQALRHQYGCLSLDGCLDINKKGDWPTRVEIVNIIRKAWCDHMRTYLSTVLSQG